MHTKLKKLLVCFISVCLLLNRNSAAEENVEIESIENIQSFVEAFTHLKLNYVDPISEADLTKKAILGLLNELDPHSKYLSPREVKNLQEATTGEFGGIGIEISLRNGLLEITKSIKESPAFQAGLRSGDIIKKINDRSVARLSLKESIELLRGPVGSEVKLHILQSDLIDDKKGTQIVKRIERSIIKISSTEHKILNNGIGYIKISQFHESTRKDLLKSLRKLSSNETLSGLILDLRDNPGGLLSGAIDVTDTFLDSGDIVSIKGRREKSYQVFSATQDTTLYHEPMIVLINEGSASASEIVAGALQDQDRALILGTQSFGKGSVQTVLPLSNGDAIKLTTARYYTPKGVSIQARGITPTIIVEDKKPSVAERENFSKKITPIKESDLPNHLVSKERATNHQDQEAMKKILLDKQLMQSYMILLGLDFLTKDKQKRASITE